jgi:hypothetical protein
MEDREPHVSPKGTINMGRKYIVEYNGAKDADHENGFHTVTLVEAEARFAEYGLTVRGKLLHDGRPDTVEIRMFFPYSRIYMVEESQWFR